jgi:hypothetical protein
MTNTTVPQVQCSPQQQQKADISARLIAANNQRALEMLLRIQSQVEANTVLSITSVKGRNYE